MNSKYLSKKLSTYFSSNKSFKRKGKAKKLLAVSSLALAGLPVAEAAPVYVTAATNSYLPVSLSESNAPGKFFFPKIKFVGKFSGFHYGGALGVGLGYGDRPNNQFRKLQVFLGSYTQVVGVGNGYYSYDKMVSKLSANTSIGASKPFQITTSSDRLVLSAYKNIVSTGSTYGYNYGTAWNNMNNDIAYVGFRFQPTGTGSPWHYGFLQLQITNSTAVPNKSIAIIGYGYETSPGVSIVPSVVLPVELLSFRAIARHNAFRLEWTTASEENNAGFEVQRSTDGKNFQTVEFIEGQGTTIEQQDYFYDDKALRSGQLYYYRLKQIDYNGQFEYSEIITVKLEDKQTIVVGNFYPNPTKGEVQLQFSSSTMTALTATVYNTTGQILLTNEQVLAVGENNLSFDFSALPKGNYFVKLQTGKEVQYQKLVIE